MYWRWQDQWEPLFSQLRRLQREMSDLRDGGNLSAASGPALNLWANGENLVVTAELPGFGPEEVEVSLEGQFLTLKGSRKSPAAPAGRCLRRERRDGETFARTIELPYAVDPNQVEARLDQGVLAVALKRSAGDRPRRIEVKK